jgi:hypothetical protein
MTTIDMMTSDDIALHRAALQDELDLASLELPYVNGAQEGEDPARDTALRQICDEMGKPCLLDPPPNRDDIVAAVEAVCTYLEQAEEHEDWLCREPEERVGHVWQYVLTLRRWLAANG